MVEGKAHIGSGTFPHTLVAFGKLTFKAPEWHGHVMQEGSDVFTAHYCDDCGTVVIETPRRGLSTLES